MLSSIFFDASADYIYREIALISLTVDVKNDGLLLSFEVINDAITAALAALSIPIS